MENMHKEEDKGKRESVGRCKEPKAGLVFASGIAECRHDETSASSIPKYKFLRIVSRHQQTLR